VEFEKVCLEMFSNVFLRPILRSPPRCLGTILWHIKLSQCTVHARYTIQSGQKTFSISIST